MVRMKVRKANESVRSDFPIRKPFDQPFFATLPLVSFEVADLAPIDKNCSMNDVWSPKIVEQPKPHSSIDKKFWITKVKLVNPGFPKMMAAWRNKIHQSTTPHRISRMMIRIVWKYLSFLESPFPNQALHQGVLANDGRAKMPLGSTWGYLCSPLCLPQKPSKGLRYSPKNSSHPNPPIWCFGCPQVPPPGVFLHGLILLFFY